MIKKFWTNMMVGDLHQTIAFYRDKLDFEHVMSVPQNSEEVLFAYDDSRPLAYTLLKKGGVELMFQERESLKSNVPAFDEVQGSEYGGTLTFYFEVDGVDALAERLKQDCPVVRDLHNTFYGMREVYVRDPNGYVLGFAQPLQN